MQNKKAPTVSKLEYWPILLPDSPLLNVSGLHAPYLPRIIMRITLSDGSVGWSEVPCNRGVLIVLGQIKELVLRTKATVHQIQTLLKTVVARSKKIAQEVGLTDSRGTASFDQGVTNHVRAAIQMAAYDALAAHQGVPLADLLAGGKRRRDEVMFNLYLFWVANTMDSGLRYQTTRDHTWNNPFAELRDRPVLDIEGAIRLAKAGVDSVMPGVSLIKWKFGVFHPDYEIDLLIELDKAFGGKMRFVPDPNGAWDLQTAINAVRRLRDALGDRLPYVEDLVRGRVAMAQVYAQTVFPQATNMCAANFKEHEEAVSMKAIQMTLGGDPHYMGGSDLAVELSRRCVQDWHIGFAQHSNSHTEISLWHTAHMGAAAHEHKWPFDTHYFPWQSGRGVTYEPVAPEYGGILRISDRPGLGITVNFDRVMQMHERFLCANSDGRSFTDRDDGSPADLVYGGWTRPGKERKDQWFMAGVRNQVWTPD